jgi:hypothetical protein
MKGTAQKLEVGAPVAVLSSAHGIPLDTTGFHGSVYMLDAKSGVCVQLHVCKICQPYLWYEPAMLKPINSIKPLTPEQVAKALGGRRTSLDRIGLFMSLLKAWLYLRVDPDDDADLEAAITSIAISDLIMMFTETTDKRFKDWVNQHDRRPKRAMAVIIKDRPVFDDAIEVPRIPMQPKRR